MRVEREKRSLILMHTPRTGIVIITLLATLLNFGALSAPIKVDDTISTLLASVLNDQVKKPTPYVPWSSEQRIKGIFPSYIHVNFHGDEVQHFARKHLVNFFDNNHFVTNWIVQVLLETYELGAIKLEEDTIADALNVLLTFNDENFPVGFPIIDFWPQYQNEYTNWVSWPTNIGNSAKEFEGLGKYFAIILDALGLPNLARGLELLIEFANTTTGAFRIPADFDDTAVNLALGMQLKHLFPKYYSLWESKYFNFSALAEAWVKYSYDPFSNNEDNNCIDPRTYYWLRGFIEQEYGSNKNLRLISTWAMNIKENIVNYEKGNKMPFNVNNVDASVAANGVFGLAIAALRFGNGTSAPSWFTPELVDLHLDTAKLLAWTLKTNVLGSRPDIALLYYPPIYDFYWFVARSVFLLSDAPVLPYPELEQIRDIIAQAMQIYGTNQLLERSQTSQQYTYWDDFLGDNDTDIFGKPIVRGEDRIFSTSVAINALLDTWTVSNATCKRSWRSNTPQQVKNTVSSAVTWLNDFILTEVYEHENAFFSGSMKGLSTGPWFYPANRIEHFNGTKIDPSNPLEISSNIIDAVKGFIPPQEYEEMLQKRWFGLPVPTEFYGYNSEDSTFPYWSSPTFTRAVGLLALSKYQALMNCMK